MKISLAAIFALLVLLTAPAAAPQAATVEGVAFAETIEAGDADLKLRGAGLLRYMVFIKACVGAFYLPGDVPSNRALSNVPRHLEIEYFHPISAGDFSTATIRGISQNVGMKTFEKLEPRVGQLNALYQDVAPGDRYSLTYLPDRGTTLALNRRPLGTIEGADFAAALFAIWPGPQPLDTKFKDILLGD